MKYLKWLKSQWLIVAIITLASLFLRYEPEMGIFYNVVGNVGGVFILTLIAYTVHSISSKLK